MSPAETNERVAVLETQFTEFKGDIREIKGSLEKILEHARMTNGRVTAIEAERAVEKALSAQQASARAKVLGISTSWISPAVAAVIGAAAGHFS